MGQRGPAPMPSAMKKLRTGKAKKRPKSEPRPTPGTPVMPGHIRLDKDAAACWRRLAPQLVKLGVLTHADGAAFEGLCQAYSRALYADRHIRKFGIILKDVLGGMKANPAVTISRSSWTEVRKFAQEFGLTPSARTRVTGMEDNGKPPAEQMPDGKQNAESFLFGSGTHGKVVGTIGR